MITISTGGIGPMDITTNSKAKGTAKEEKAVDAFASLMNMVSTRQEQNDVLLSDDGTGVSEVASTKNTSKDYDTYKEQKNIESAQDKYQNTETTEVKEDTQVNQSKQSDAVGEKETDSTVVSVAEEDADVEVAEVVDKLVLVFDEIKNVIMESLDITEEEMNNLLADMGINLADLAIGDNLKNFVLQVKGATNVDLLVNEELANLVTDITAEISTVIESYDFENVKEFQQFLDINDKAVGMALQKVGVNADIPIDDINVDASQEIDVIDDNGNDVRNNEISDKINNDNTDVEEIIDDVDDDFVKVVSKNKVDGEEIGSKDSGLGGKIVDNTASDLSQAMTDGSSPNQDSQQIATNLNQALDNAIMGDVNVDATTFTDSIQEADIIRQIIDQIKVNTGRDVQSMEVQLNPENLGKVYVNVETKDGVMQAKIVAETEAAKNAIENNLAVLKENFSNNELKVEAIEVMVATYGFFEENQNGDFGNEEQANDTSKSIGGINVNNLDEEELTEEEELEVEIMKSKGNTVSYTV